MIRKQLEVTYPKDTDLAAIIRNILVKNQKTWVKVILLLLIY